MRSSLSRAGLLAAALLALVSCAADNGGGGAARGDFGKEYLVARQALENGEYDKASGNYLRLIGRAGRLAPQLRLELSHSYLRAGAYAAASDQAQGLADTQAGTLRSAALAVYGTAEHELGRAALGAGDRAGAKAHLTAAAGALAEVLSSAPQLDPLGSLEGRRAEIAAQLKRLG